MTYSDIQLAKLREEAGKGREVAALTQNETFKTVLTDSLHGIQNAWLREINRDRREELWQQGAGLQALLDNLQSMVNTGKMAEQQLETERKLREHNENVQNS